MMNFDIKRKINTLRDILVGKVPDPKAQGVYFSFDIKIHHDSFLLT